MGRIGAVPGSGSKRCAGIVFLWSVHSTPRTPRTPIMFLERVSETIPTRQHQPSLHLQHALVGLTRSFVENPAEPATLLCGFNLIWNEKNESLATVDPSWRMSPVGLFRQESASICPTFCPGVHCPEMVCSRGLANLKIKISAMWTGRVFAPLRY